MSQLPVEVMKIRNYVKSYPALASIILHLLVLCSCIFYLNHSSAEIHLGKPDLQIMHSYVYESDAVNTETTENQTLKTIVQSIKQHSNNLGILKLSRALRSTPVARRADKNLIPQTVQISAASQGQRAAELITLLHAAIQQQQHYPLSALQMEREGKVTVMFTLHKDGTITQLQILKSSGTASLDEAAIAAVHDAVPFEHIERYLQQSQVYNVDIAFELI